MSGICDTCHRDQCNLRMDGLKMCDLHERGESNYERLFGTPERAAQTIRRFSPLACSYCALESVCGDDINKDCLLCDYAALLEWLKGEDEVIDEPDTIRNELTDSGLLRGDAE